MTTSNLTKLIEQTSKYKCDVCGSPVRLHSSKEGTSFYSQSHELKDEMLTIMAEALEWVIHPKHREPHDCIRFGCAQLRAHEALSRVNELAGKAIGK